MAAARRARAIRPRTVLKGKSSCREISAAVAPSRTMRSRTNRIEKSVARGIEVDPYSVKPTNLAKVYQVRRKRETLCRYLRETSCRVTASRRAAASSGSEVSVRAAKALPARTEPRPPKFGGPGFGRAKLLLSRDGLCRLGRSLALPSSVAQRFGRAKLLLSRDGLCRLGRSLALPSCGGPGFGRAKLLLSRDGLCRLGRSLALPESRKAV